jgi:hypothetical protein
MAKRGILLVHWNEAEARDRAARLRKAGLRVAGIVHDALTPGAFKKIWASPPEACVIDLSRLPSHGREVALGLRERKATRTVPIVFLEGDPEKVARIRSVIPEAVYGSWSSVGALLKRALANPPPDVPRKRFDAYSGTPLPEKLGIKPGTTVALLGAPEGFEKTLGKASVGSDGAALALWFVRSRGELEAGIARRAREIPPNGMWICWPKKASGIESDLSEEVVRKTGLAAGIVDFKICSVDSTWSGLKFTTRKRVSP